MGKGKRFLRSQYTQPLLSSGAVQGDTESSLEAPYIYFLDRLLTKVTL